MTPRSGKSNASLTSTLQVTVNAAGLAPGTYHAAVLITGGDGSQTTVPVSLTVSNGAGKLLLSQTGLTFTAVQGVGVSADQSFQALNAGAGKVRWTSAASLPGPEPLWLSIGNQSGVLQSGTPGTDIPVHVNAGGLAAGTYYGQVLISSPDGDQLAADDYAEERAQSGKIPINSSKYLNNTIGSFLEDGRVAGRTSGHSWRGGAVFRRRVAPN